MLSRAVAACSVAAPPSGVHVKTTTLISETRKNRQGGKQTIWLIRAGAVAAVFRHPGTTSLLSRRKKITTYESV